MVTPYPRPAAPAAPRRLPLGERRPSPAELIEKRISEQIAQLIGRIKIIEERIDTLRSHIELIDKTVIEKHKASISEIRDLQDSMRSLKADSDEAKELSERIIKRLEAFASKEEVKVLERYIDAWQPLNYITRSELKATVISILKDLGFKIKEKK